MQSRALWGIAAGSLLFVACGGDRSPPRGGDFYTPPPKTPTTNGTGACTVARGSEELVPRVDLTGMSASNVGGQNVAYTSDLFGTFSAFCGGCHVDGAQGNRHIDKKVEAFVAGFDSTWLDRIMSDDPNTWMPPKESGKAWSERVKARDAIYDFVTHAQAWLAAGKPTGVYAVDDGSGGGAPTAKADYSFTSSVAAAMTNIGNCVPNSALFASGTSDVMTSMDEFFKGATELPKTLAETDLTSLDSEVLAKTAVIAYVPTYALWSAGSGKLRHIRVPRGQSVRFDKATQTFDIPDNTRFYKTFLRKVRDRTGAIAWRKMETRVILARADDTDPATGAARQNALFGTYIWSEDETTATLASQPYRDLTPWADIVREYVTDELLYQDIVDTTTGDINGAVALAIKSHPDEPAYRDLLQHYAIPGKLRCVQCHMGSPTKDFVLGFIPLQVKRRETGTGGTYDVTGADELTQLQRLIDVGVITGITSPDDVKPLEESQGTRTPRKTASAVGEEMTDNGELKAQAYMLGNCAHCHNPRGFPSITKPELTNKLNFLPDGKDGGIFQFPLERYSPIRVRGANGDVPIPYVTPSLHDYPTVEAGGVQRLDTGEDITSTVTYTPKFYPPDGLHASWSCADKTYDPEFRSYCGDRTTGSPVVSAPWRSLIYRNVETPAAYFDDFVPFPHMPMNTAGFDCRAPRIMGDWMVGLPSVRKLAQLAAAIGFTDKLPSEDVFDAIPNRARQPVPGSLKSPYDDNAQPFVDVPPESELYKQALADARVRMVEYHDSVRYQYCQDVISPDIFDTFVPVAVPEYTYHPDPYQYQRSNTIEAPPADPMHPERYVQPRIGVPFHAHWINYDPTEPPPPWVPRRSDWREVLVDGVPDKGVPVGMKSPAQLEAEGNTDAADVFRRKRAYVARALGESQLTDALRKYALTDQPFGTWVSKPDCKQKLAASQQTVSALMSAAGAAGQPAWFSVANPDRDAYVFKMAPGASIFRHVCINCHGPNADGKGIQVDLLSAASEGEARPANFKGGLFGPAETPLSNILATFDVAHTGSMAAADTWGSRYMAWMALGGTLKRIPQDIIHLVASTPILGHARTNLGSLPGAADPTGNMLNLGKALCSIVLPAPTSTTLPDFEKGLFAFESNRSLVPPGAGYPPFSYSNSPFVDTTYDKEMWLHLCSDFSPQIVRVYGATADPVSNHQTIELMALYYAFDPNENESNRNPANKANFPADAFVWDQTRAKQTGVKRENLYPACLDPGVAGQPGVIPPATIAEVGMPVCPPDFLANAKPLWRTAHPRFPSTDDQLTFAGNIQVWELRGAIAAGMSVFSYLERRLSDPNMAKLPPYYDQCELLP